MHSSWPILYLLLTTTAIAAPPALSPALQQILHKAHQAPLYTYPTSLTQGIIPKPIHSHNDYWRPVPFYSALSVGAISIEADVWLYNDTLYVGHEQSALKPERTFQSLYIDPILDTLRRQNPASSFLTAATHNGVFDTDGQQTLYLFVDVKTSGAETWPFVVRALEPLRANGWLSHINTSNQYTSRAITIIGTGNTPLSQIQSVAQRYYFFDAPIPTLDSNSANMTSLLSPIASTSFSRNFGAVYGTSLNDTQLALLRRQVKVAHEKGIKLRYWDQPGWPISTRNGIWRQLKSEGVDFVNVDDLDAAAGVGEGVGYW